MDWILFVLGNILTAVTVTGADAGLNLICTNDLVDTMSCNLNAQNCPEYRMTLKNKEATERCSFSPCDRGCCCSITNMMLVYGETFNANVQRGDQSVESKEISIKDTIKPRTPSIVSVKEFKGNFMIEWKTNVGISLLGFLKAEVTYWKKGTNETHKTPDEPPTITEDLNFSEIRSEALEPRTAYVVSVKTYFIESGRFSDSSNETEFTTPRSTFRGQVVLISTLSVAAVIISSVTFLAFVKMKTNWWDKPVKCQKPKLLDIRPQTPEVLIPVLTAITIVRVEPTTPDAGKTGSKESLTYSSSGSPKSSGISTGSSSSSYANTEPVDVINGVRAALMKKLPGFGPASPGATTPLTESDRDSGLLSSAYNPVGVRADASSSSSSSFSNKTYSIVIPAEVQTQDVTPCDSTYHPSEASPPPCPAPPCPAPPGPAPPCLAPPLINISAVLSPAMTTDMSYQQCPNADSGGFSCAEDSSQRSQSSRPESQWDRLPDRRRDSGTGNLPAAEVSRWDAKPCYGGAPQDLRSPLVDYEYQAFPSVVEQPDAVIPERTPPQNPPHESEPTRPEAAAHSQSAAALPDCHTALLPFASADQPAPLTVDCGYQSV